MKKIIKKFLNFLKHPLTIIVVILIVWIIGFILFFKDAMSELPATLFGYSLAIFQTAIFKQYRAIKEDTLKSNQKASYLKKKYDLETPIVLDINGNKKEIFFTEICDATKKIEIKHSDTEFELDSFITNNYFNIISAHSMSTFKNHKTLRLSSVVEEEDKIIFNTEKSDYYKHMVTNRAIDYKIQGNLTLRSMYEQGPKLREFVDSNFSNHIGINCLVIFNDNKIILPHRNNNATYSKNKVTASIASRLLIDDYKNVSMELGIDTIVNVLMENYKFDNNEISKYRSKIKFVGAARTIYEGGKPQFYYVLKIDDMSGCEYYSKHGGKCLVTAMNTEIDQYKRLYLADLKSLDIKEDNKLKFNYFDKKLKSKTCNVELSMYTNLYYIIKNSK
ncbi:hypothetical protein [Haploplasma axanthum]|uniref:Uncharacterized protein n=1 Tax=Haploplasma axanthum TaxID=29552 RepID=A0A449BBM9_HAPAX|nr:hypothetical protein [Haploplasma axanthum]VEU79832.1 Uncharacterised protein [Haploplasma axanthum]